MAPTACTAADTAVHGQARAQRRREVKITAAAALQLAEQPRSGRSQARQPVPATRQLFAEQQIKPFSPAIREGDGLGNHGRGDRLRPASPRQQTTLRRTNRAHPSRTLCDSKSGASGVANTRATRRRVLPPTSAGSPLVPAHGRARRHRITSPYTAGRVNRQGRGA